MKDEITITRKDFKSKLYKLCDQSISRPVDLIRFAIFSSNAETIFFGEIDEVKHND